MTIARITGLWRYPVKSLQGEQLDRAVLEENGEPHITLPDGDRLRGAGPRTDAALSAWLGRPVTLGVADGTSGAKAEAFTDATDDTSPIFEWTMPPDRFVDAMPLLVLTTASLRAGEASIPPASGTCVASGPTSCSMSTPLVGSKTVGAAARSASTASSSRPASPAPAAPW